MGFAERLPTRPLPIKQCCGCRATAIAVQCIQEAGPNAGMENEALVVFTRRRGSHDQSEDAAISWPSAWARGAIAQHRPQSDVHGAKSRDRRDPGGGTSNNLATGPSRMQQNLLVKKAIS